MLGLAAQDAEDLVDEPLVLFDLSQLDLEQDGELLGDQSLDLAHEMGSDPLAVDGLGLDGDLDGAGAVFAATQSEQVGCGAQAKHADVVTLLALVQDCAEALAIELCFHAQTHPFVDVAITHHGGLDVM